MLLKIFQSTYQLSVRRKEQNLESISFTTLYKTLGPAKVISKKLTYSFAIRIYLMLLYKDVSFSSASSQEVLQGLSWWKTIVQVYFHSGIKDTSLFHKGNGNLTFQ